MCKVLCSYYCWFLHWWFHFALFIFMKDDKVVNYNGSEIIGLINLKYGKRAACREKVNNGVLISTCYRIEQHITLIGDLASLFTVRIICIWPYLTPHSSWWLWCRGMTLAYRAERPGFETHKTLCGIGYFFIATVFCIVCSLFPTMANISIFLSHWHSHINLYSQFSQLMRCCKDGNECNNWWYLCIVY